jgi:sugar phosphate isomerase/epimerase
MKLGYHTNGLSHHRAIDGLNLLAEIGYKSVAISVDHGWLSPDEPQTRLQIQEIKGLLLQHGMSSVIETDARFLLDSKQLYHPTLLDKDPQNVNKRIEYYKHCIDVGAELNSDCVSIFSGQKSTEMTFNSGLEQLTKNLGPVLDYAQQRGIDIGFEPVPGMLIDTMGRFDRMYHLIDSARFKLTLDIGQLFCMSEIPIAEFINKWSNLITNVHISDMKPGLHEHLMFGEGQIYYPPILESLYKCGYQGSIHVELDRHCHVASETAQRSFDLLEPMFQDVTNKS